MQRVSKFLLSYLRRLSHQIQSGFRTWQCLQSLGIQLLFCIAVHEGLRGFESCAWKSRGQDNDDSFLCNIFKVAENWIGEQSMFIISRQQADNPVSVSVSRCFFMEQSKPMWFYLLLWLGCMLLLGQKSLKDAAGTSLAHEVVPCK